MTHGNEKPNGAGLMRVGRRKPRRSVFNPKCLLRLLSPVFVRRQARRPVLQGGHRALPQLQRSPLRRAQRAHALPGLPDRRGAEQLLHLDGEVPAAAR